MPVAFKSVEKFGVTVLPLDTRRNTNVKGVWRFTDLNSQMSWLGLVTTLRVIFSVFVF